MTPEQHEALTHIDADRKRWMACELQVDCQISNAEAAELVEEYFRDDSKPIGWWYQDSTGCIHMSLDMDLGHRHERETGHSLNLMYGKPLPCKPFRTPPPPQTHTVGPDTATVAQHMKDFEAFVAQIAPKLHWKVWQDLGPDRSLYSAGFDGWQHGFGMTSFEPRPLAELIPEMKAALALAATATGDGR